MMVACPPGFDFLLHKPRISSIFASKPSGTCLSGDDIDMFNKKKNVYSESELIEGLQKSGAEHERWVQRLFQQYGGYVYKGKRKFNISLEAAKDAYADSIIAVSRQIQLGKFQGKSSLATYVYRVFSNYSIKQYHKEQRQPHWVDEMPMLADSAKNRLEELLVREDIQQLYQWIDQLGPSCRDILILREFEGLSPQKIADRIGFQNAKSVSSKRIQCLNRLRKLAHSFQRKMNQYYE
ncbi:MAG: sigma-70 family RNA polymerase sigma factor [Bacteroidota bacterium]